MGITSLWSKVRQSISWGKWTLSSGRQQVYCEEFWRSKIPLDIKAVVEMAEIPYKLIINWDQITAVFAGSLTGDFLPVKLVCKGTTTKCLPSVLFHQNSTSQQHKTTGATGYNGETFWQDNFPLVTRKKNDFETPDEFSGQFTNRVLSLIKANM